MKKYIISTTVIQLIDLKSLTRCCEGRRCTADVRLTPPSKEAGILQLPQILSPVVHNSPKPSPPISSLPSLYPSNYMSRGYLFFTSNRQNVFKAAFRSKFLHAIAKAATTLIPRSSRTPLCSRTSLLSTASGLRQHQAKDSMS